MPRHETIITRDTPLFVLLVQGMGPPPGPPMMGMPGPPGACRSKETKRGCKVISMNAYQEMLKDARIRTLSSAASLAAGTP